MPQFRKRPVIISAEQYRPGREIEGVVMKAPMLGGRGHGAIVGPPQPYVETLEGDMAITPGDWIIVGVKGERYNCRDDIFRMTYQPVDEAGEAIEWEES